MKTKKMITMANNEGGVEFEAKVLDGDSEVSVFVASIGKSYVIIMNIVLGFI